MRFRFAKTLRVYILALGKHRKSILKVKLYLQHDLHVHRATGTSYSPILACGMRVQVKTRCYPIFLKFQNKHFYSPNSNELLDIKALEYKEYFTHIDLWQTLKKISKDILPFMETKYKIFGQAVSKSMIFVMLL
jgi:hypothetical protein